MDRERISRLEALLARVQAAREQAAREHARADDAHPSSDHEELSPDDLEWAGKSEPPPAPPLPDSPQISIPTRPAFAPMAASLEEAFEQYELDAETAEEVVEIAPDAEDDSVRPSVRPPIMIDAEFEAAAKIEADRAARSDDAQAAEEEPAPDELQSQQRLVVATPYSEHANGVDSGELEVIGEADLEDDVMDADTDDLIEESGELAASQTNALADHDVPSSNRPTREMSAILESGLDAPEGNANRPLLELQESEEEIEEPPPSSRRPVSHEEVREAELTFENEIPRPPMTPPPESGPQAALPIHADLRGNPEVADVIAPQDVAPSTFGDLLDDALTL